MGCIVSKLFLYFYIFFIFTRPLTFLSNWSRDRIDSSISVSSMEYVGVKACLSR